MEDRQDNMKNDKNDKSKRPGDESIFDQFYDMSSVQSSTDMTGLVPRPPLTGADAESYSQIHGIPIPGDPPRKRKEKRERPDEPQSRG